MLWQIDRTATIRRDPRFQFLTAELRFGTEALRDAEDENRDRQRAAEFGPNSIELARSVYTKNDDRMAFTHEVNVPHSGREVQLIEHS
jgi:hypothetical protein